MYYDIDQHEIRNIVDKKIKGSFLYMSIALIVTFLTGYFTVTNEAVRSTSYTLLPLFLILQFVLPLSMSLFIYKANATILRVMFVIYSISTGVILSFIAEYYTLGSVISVLSGTIVLFLVLTIYGYTTKSNLQSYTSFLFVGIISIIIMSVINMFIGSNTLDLLLSALAVVVFVIYTAYDTQRIKNTIISLSYQGQLDLLDRVEIIGALSLYLDFINLFIYLIRIFGRRKD
ncbi:Bax inhibitor-1/YccA family protein [uncultured Sneathia sp.]|uniref:Bax inhibitor-1/YccA family protein n=1 Tax=uncultured Sneathia sp. TaxID=278067 RepID=UPI0025962EA8|nr:Bax inhibitor-1/YccA family protein [uncultured Sneathia sp.]